VSAGGRRPRLLAVWLLLVVLGGAIGVIEYTDRTGPQSQHDSHGSAAARLLLPVPVDQLGAIEVVHGRTLHRFERDAAGVWFYHVHGTDTDVEEHHSHAADPSVAARIADALAAFGRTRLERQVAPETHATAYGVTTPQMLILVYRPHTTQPLEQYVIGDLAPDALSRYVLVVGRAIVATIPNYQIDHLLGLIKAVAGTSTASQAPPSAP
jgi:hypothetical protein